MPDVESEADATQEAELVAGRRDATQFNDAEEAIMRSLLCGFPDRLAKRRSIGNSSALMVGGRAVQVASTSGVHDAELFVCVDVDGRGTEAVVRQASMIDRKWLDPTLVQQRDDLFFHPSQQQVVARRRILWDDLVLAETPVAIGDREAAAEILYKASLNTWHAVFPSEDRELISLIERTQWLLSIAPDIDLPSLNTEMIQSVCRELCNHHTSFSELKKARWYDWVANRFSVPQRQLLDREAPEKLQVPSGSWIRLEYAEGKPPILPVKIQEVFSWKRTPRLAMGRVPVLLHLLAPNMRPQQITDDLESFWATGYTMVKKELKRRYPKHSWPDDPTTAVASKR
jgi:ATP-dependent helicase HrpB